MSDRPVRVRIGPSPTGEPHVGTAYIALYNLAFADKHGGQFVLRIEDTDQERSRPEWEQQIMDALAWLGLDWHEGPDKGGPYGPYRQSQRSAIYQQHVQQLLDAGHAYRCWATKEELDAERARLEADKGDRSAASRLHRDLDPALAERYLAEGRPYVVRMKAPLEGTVVVQDRLRGAVEFDAAQVDDQILMKSDGFPTYHLANVVDDHLMEISHVIRAEEWISSTPKHVLLYEMFGWAAPTFVHMPLLRNPGGSKISKRKAPVSLMDYQERGYLPEAVVNYLGQLSFTMPDERDVFTFAEFRDALELDRISTGGPVFDLEKLSWLNGKYLREQRDDAGFVAHLEAAVFDPAYLARIAPLFRERVDVAEQFLDAAHYFFVGEVQFAPAAMLPKKKTFKDLAAVLERLADAVDRQVDFSAEALEAFARAFADEVQWKAKDLFMALRVVLTGRTASPPLFDVMSVLGRARTRRRLRAALATAKTEAKTEARAAKAEDATSGGAPPADKKAKKAKADKNAGPPLDAVDGLDDAAQAKLQSAGVTDTHALLDRAGAAADRASLASATGLDAQTLLDWAHQADLFRIKGLAGPIGGLLRGAGIRTLAQLGAAHAATLAETLAKAAEASGGKPPNPRAVAVWVDRAKALTPRVEG